MGLLRFLVIGALVWVVLMWIRRQRAPARRKTGEAQAKLVRCARCGVYLPESETRADAEQARICAHH